MVVCDPDRPAAARRLAAHGDVAAERDEDAAAGRRRGCARRAIGRERFRRRAEIELDAGRDA